ncbi:MAG: CoA transferase [Myxococcales bacterium]|nr:CoA transferase [Myxococcales bacterium]
MIEPAPAALAGLRVVELAHERIAFAGKLLADMGACVIVVEPPRGAAGRWLPPFVNDEVDPERSLNWWHYNTSKLGVTLDIDDERGRDALRKLVATADFFIESEDPGRLAALSLAPGDLEEVKPDLITISMTPFGSSGPRCDEPATDLTILAGGGPAWMCGYDDHTLPPVRGGGNQGYHTGCHFAVMSGLTALLVRDATGVGQHIDVNMHAAANVTTEAGSYAWLVSGDTMQRQTGRHASSGATMESQIQCRDGRYANTGVPPRQPKEFAAVAGWVRALGLEEEFPEVFLLEMGGQREFIDLTMIGKDEEVTAIFGAGRDAMNLIASKLPAYEFFAQGQERGIPLGVIYSPEEVMSDPHFEDRGFPVVVDHEELGEVVYPGAPYKFGETPWRIQRRAPRLGEHNAVVLRDLGLDEREIADLAGTAPGTEPAAR